jgi:hypothetical protein
VISYIWKEGEGVTSELTCCAFLCLPGVGTACLSISLFPLPLPIFPLLGLLLGASLMLTIFSLGRSPLFRPLFQGTFFFFFIALTGLAEEPAVGASDAA